MEREVRQVQKNINQKLNVFYIVVIYRQGIQFQP